jgi:hypothetical protein
MSGFLPSNYKFVDPIRYFKENDPYYWEVDNIPLKQLQENCLWLKDQLQLNVISEGINREDFNELKPYVTGSDNVLRVKAGRFTARINDAYNKSPIQKLELITGTGLNSLVGASIGSTFTPSRYRTLTGAEYATTLFTALQEYSTSAFNLNGLTERVLSWPYTNPNNIGPTVTISNNTPSFPEGQWPVLSARSFFNQILSTDNLQALSVEFCRQFRGVARTAVVDVPEELTLQIPEFDAQDFFVLTSDGSPIYIPEGQLEYRIDLAFIYSKPIDTSSSYIQEYTGQLPREITKPTLGILRGAGVGLKNRENLNQSTSPFTNNSLIAADGKSSIMAHAADKAVITNGFQSAQIDIHGSFPSPDDLMNLAPVISEKLSDSDPRLVGQSILPIAYIVVRKNPTFAAGVAVVNESDILDIRPFFRTTELTYNERAGIAAAIPSPSLANPVATKYVVENAVQNIKTYVDSNFEPKIINQPRRPLVLAGGVIQGGSLFGPEGILVALDPSMDLGYAVTQYPGWDFARWWTDSTVANRGGGNAPKGTKRADWLDYVKVTSTEEYGVTVAPRQGAFTGNDFTGFTRYAIRGAVCRRTIRVPKNTIPSGYQRISLIPNYKYCAPRVVTGQDDDRSTYHQFCGLYTERKETATDIYFIIYSFTSQNSYLDGAADHVPWADSREAEGINNYLVQSNSMRLLQETDESGFDNNGESVLSYGGCTYPTVEFTIVGYPSGFYSVDGRNNTAENAELVISLNNV